MVVGGGLGGVGGEIPLVPPGPGPRRVEGSWTARPHPTGSTPPTPARASGASQGRWRLSVHQAGSLTRPDIGQDCSSN